MKNIELDYTDEFWEELASVDEGKKLFTPSLVHLIQSELGGTYVARGSSRSTLYCIRFLGRALLLTQENKPLKIHPELLIASAIFISPVDEILESSTSMDNITRVSRHKSDYLHAIKFYAPSSEYLLDFSIASNGSMQSNIIRKQN